MLRLRPPVLAALTAALVLAAAPRIRAQQGPRGPVPAGGERATFEIQVRGHAVGRETVDFEPGMDSLRISSHSLQMLGAAGRDSLIKRTHWVVGLDDLDLSAYTSEQRLFGHVLARGVMCHDTLLDVATYADGRGAQDTYAKPPGRLFVVDAGSFVSFDLVCRMLRGRPFVTRPVNMLILGRRDTIVTASLEDGGPDTLRWAARRVIARRVAVVDRDSRYTLWMDPEGRMLRLENAWGGVRVDRVPPAIKPARTRPR